MTGLTEQELAEIEARHQLDEWDWQPDEKVRECEQCSADCGSVPWPCDAARLLAEVRRLREGIRQFLESAPTSTVTRVGRTDVGLPAISFRAKRVDQFDALQHLVESTKEP